MAQFFALITTIDGGGGLRPDNTLPVPPPGWDTFPKPMPQPPGIWGGPPLYPDQGLPGPQPPSGGRPTHPIYNPAYPDNTLPQPPLGIWGGGNVPMPSPPIYFPPEGGGGSPGVPTHPIVLPPDLPPETGDNRPIEWKAGWTPQTGWIVVGIPTGPTPTPSR